MTVYGRSDICYVAISRDHGGCGEGHARPVTHGAPAKVWALTCHGGCEDFLRHDPLWAPTPQGIPETPDETVTREDVEKRGQIDQAASVAEALERLASLGDLPNALMHVMSQLMAGAQAKAIEPDKRIIEESVSPALEDAPPADEADEGSEALSGAPGDLEELSMGQLRELAVARGLRTARSKEDQIAVIREAEQE